MAEKEQRSDSEIPENVGKRRVVAAVVGFPLVLALFIGLGFGLRNGEESESTGSAPTVEPKLEI